MKIPVMIEVLRRAEAGEFAMSDKLLVDPVCESFIDGSPFRCDPGRRLARYVGQEVPITLLTEEMMVVSDNLATNLLIEKVGPRSITATMRALGAKDGYVLRGVMDEEAFRAGLSNRVTANDLVALLVAIEEGRAAGPEATAEMRRILLAQEYGNRLPAQLSERVSVGYKTGLISGIRHDAGIVYTDDGWYAVAILTRDMGAGGEVTGMIADLSRRVFDARAGVTRGDNGGTPAP